MAKLFEGFNCILVNHAKVAAEFQPPGGGANIMLFDPDGEKILTANVQAKDSDEAATRIRKALDQFKEKYSDKEVSWTETEGAEGFDENRGKLFVYALADEKDASTKTLAAFQHAWIAKDHAKLVFVKITDKEGELAKRLKLTSFPSIAFADPTLGDKQVLETKSGETSARAIKLAITKCLEKMEKAKKK